MDWTDKADSSSSAIIKHYHLADLEISHGDRALSRLFAVENEEVSTVEVNRGRGGIVVEASFGPDVQANPGPAIALDNASGGV